LEILDISHSQEIYSVSRLNREVRTVLEGSFAVVWIEGEISNFVAPQSGHWYFSLKDSSAQVRCAMFRPFNRMVVTTPKDGMHVLIKARVSLYEGRGDFQLIVEHLEEAGEGKLRQAFEALKKRLAEAGLFADTHKKKLPAFPKTIGIVTSATGAAIRDILTVLRRRYACAKVIVYQTLVQGDYAAPNIVNAIQVANRRAECDVLILARGGGSLEDLWPFNDERVAYAIYHSVLPIISGVGHEIDFTIADFVADVRAPTPSAAAELVTPALEELLETLEQEKKHLYRCIKQKVSHTQQQLEWTRKHLNQQHPKRRLAEQTQQLDLYEIALVKLQNRFLQTKQAELHHLAKQLHTRTPRRLIQEIRQRLVHDTKHLSHCILKVLHRDQTLLSTLAGKLDGLSPLATLSRGFSIVTSAKTHRIISKASEVTIGEKIKVQLSEGILNCQVEEKGIKP